MEMNTRLQVEHPVTEAVLGLDLVELQLRVAAGERLPWPEAAPVPTGTPSRLGCTRRIRGRDFPPPPARSWGWTEPSALPHVRVDSALKVGTTIGTSYDPMLAKVVAWGRDRPEALARLQAALAR